MRERPILFSGAMVRAILAGTKTQTRRIAKPVRHPDLGNLYDPGALVLEHEPQHVIDRACPYGQPGDRLWVRETWADLIAVSPSSDEPLPIGPGERLIEPPTSWVDGKGRTRWHYDGKVIAYRANSKIEFCDGDGFSGEFADRSDMPSWRPSIHMPKAFARIWLEVAAVRVERLQDISEADAKAEGALGYEEGVDPPPPDGDHEWSYRASFERLWESINGPGSWRANPWVWVVEFKRVEAAVVAPQGEAA